MNRLSDNVWLWLWSWFDSTQQHLWWTLGRFVKTLCMCCCAAGEAMSRVRLTVVTSTITWRTAACVQACVLVVFWRGEGVGRHADARTGPLLHGLFQGLSTHHFRHGVAEVDA
jgi:hypothetical protein